MICDLVTAPLLDIISRLKEGQDIKIQEALNIPSYKVSVM